MSIEYTENKLIYLHVLVDHARSDDFAILCSKNAEGKQAYKRAGRAIGDDDLKRHLENNPNIGTYVTRPASGETQLAVFDLDDHKGVVEWSQMRQIALSLVVAVLAMGLYPWCVRSGGGRGIHLFFRWDQPQAINLVRAAMTSLLEEIGFREGAGGVAIGEIEIFPKKINAASPYGSLISLPFGRESVPLDAELQPSATVPNWLSSGALLPTEPRMDSADPSHRQIEEALQFVPADDYGRWCEVGFALKNELGEDGFIIWDRWSKMSGNYPGQAEVRRKWDRDLKPNGKITIASIFHWAREGGWKGQDFQRARQNPWPLPLAEAAFHGLAGEVVRAIGPHSEADPAALLMQFLAAFGNCVGRTGYYLVEGDRHFTNIFIVLVGKTSKARKGTSWGRVREMFLAVEDPWILDRINSGLSSGEGLIWEVRDPITKMETDKKSGVSTEVVVDPGVADKRLLVQESEFAGVLRIMMREGSILSRVIRDAWDRAISQP